METNKEHYAKEIIEVVLNGETPMVTIKGEIKDCGGDGLGKCEECIFRDIPCYNVKYLQKLRKWANAEYHEPVPKLTELEIEELSYYMHNGYEMIEYKNGYRALAEWRPLKDNEFNRLLFCKYEHLEKNKKYKIKDLLEGQNVK